MTAYINSKTGQLDQVLQSFFQDDMAVWPQAPPPTQLRDACLEVLFSLVISLLCFAYTSLLEL